MVKNVHRRIISIVLTLIMTISFMPAGPNHANASGDGSSGYPFEISTAEQLYSIRDHLGYHFIQTADITIDTTTYPSWSPIGTSTTPFTGSYNGGNYKINNLKINTTAETDSNTILGLFGVVGSSATLSNIKLENVDIDVATGSSSAVESFIGGLAGINLGTISNCSITGNIDAASYNIKLGGLVGNNGSGGATDDGNITGSTSDCIINVTVNYQQGHIGGLVGSSFTSGSSITNCSSSGTVIGTGGSTIYNTGVFSGGLIGYASDTVITQCSSDATVSALNARSQAHAGGLIGGIVGSCSISNCSSTGNATANDAAGSTGTKVCAGGLIGYSFSGSQITDCNSSGAATANGTGASTSTGTHAYVYSGGFLGYGSQGSVAVDISQCYATGNSNATVNTYGYAFAGGFGGYYMKANISESYSKGNAQADSIAGYASSGGFTGYLYGANATTSPSTLTNCFSTGNASANCADNERVGGLSGVIHNSTVSYCYSTGIPSVAHDTFLPKSGGLTGVSSLGTISNCYYDSTVSGKIDTDKGLPMATADMKKSTFIPSLTNAGAGWKLVSNLNSGYPVIDGVGLGGLPTCTVSYLDSENTSTTYGTDTVAQDFVFSLPTSINPTKSGKTFSGWYTASSYTSTEEWDFTTDKISVGTLNLYAGWDVSDTVKPTLMAGAVSRTSDLNATIKFTSNEAGSYYYSVVNDGAEAPIINTGGIGADCTTAETTIILSTLTAGAQDIYIQVKDAAGNISEALMINIAAYTAPDTTNAQEPQISTQITDISVHQGGTAVLTVIATVSGGALSYKWYSNTTDSTVGGTAITGAADSTYTAPTSIVGTVWYYCVITNTDTSVGGIQTATVSTQVAAVTVSLPAPASGETGLASILGQTITAGSEAGTDSAPKIVSINVASSVSTITVTDIVMNASGSAITFHGTDSTFTTLEAGSVNLAEGAATNIYIKVKTVDDIILCYKISINRAAGNAAPIVNNVIIGGTAKVGQTLTGSYTYSDTNGDLEGTSTYQWYRSNDAAGTGKTAISGATARTYMLTVNDLSKYISFEITPAAVTGSTPGIAVESARTEAVAALDTISPPVTSPTQETTKESKVEKIIVDVKDGNTDDTVSKITVERTTDDKGNKSDIVTYQLENAVETIAKLKEEGKDVARIVILDEKDEVSDTTVNIPSKALEALAKDGINLQLDTQEAKIYIPKASLGGVSSKVGDNLYFNVVPVKDDEIKNEVENRARFEVGLLNSDNKISIVGSPVVIETNMPSSVVDITLVLTGVTIPTNLAERELFLKQLVVYIEHSDGEKELVQGEIVEYAEGVMGIKFQITKFSIFTIVKTDAFMESTDCNITKVVTPKNATLKKNNISASVSYKTASLTVKVTTSKDAIYKLYSDKACKKELNSKKLKLKVGANKVYIKVTAEDGKTSKIYTFKITRKAKPIKNIIVATTFDFSDAFAGGILANQTGSTLIRIGNTKKEIQQVVNNIKKEYSRKDKIYILGLNQAVDTSLITKLKEAGFTDITVIGGQDKYETALKISEKLKVTESTKVVLVNGEIEPTDAKNIQKACITMGYPILFVKEESLTSYTIKALKEINPAQVYIAGGKSQISAKIIKEIQKVIELDKSSIIRISMGSEIK